MDFSYLLKKISTAQINNHPFQHIKINDFFHPEDFEKIISSPDIKLLKCKNDDQLFDELFKSDYRIIGFPGCTSNQDEYIKWHKTKKSVQKSNTACESFGMVLRLVSPKTNIVSSLQKFLMSNEFVSCISEKFGVEIDKCNYDAGIQKYLDGYEISPHPDIRRKALTYMVNINPDPESHLKSHHTSYLQLKSKYVYVKSFWSGNEKYDRCWVPWEWCDIKTQQLENNSIVIFSPSNDTMHAVRADYNHLEHQRTQLYGNLWYKHSNVDSMPSWEMLELPIQINPNTINSQASFINGVKSLIPNRVKELLKGTKTESISDSTHVDRKY